jgi:polysaccharide pyruvyl transferase WcaK-like protein
MPKKILLINSDLAKNRGDRAIAEGIIQLIKQQFPGATTMGLSEQAERDKAWFDIEFLDQDSQSLNPIDFFKLLRAAHQADIVLWGGGEILKDYTNKLALWYWVVKISLLSQANQQIYGAFQGIGPTKAAVSRHMIAFIVRHTQRFIVRDQESKDKLVAWGVPADKVIASSDPAVLPEANTPSTEIKTKLAEINNIDEAFLKNFVCFGPRSWFHYKTGGIIPFRYKKALLKLVGKELGDDSAEYTTYKQRLVAAIDTITQTQNCHMLLVPMHMNEDPELCQYLLEHITAPERVRVLATDDYSPAELRSIMGQARVMIGFRLHSTIIATSSAVPSINLYYVDKGRVYFDQIGQSHYALPIERVLDENFVADLTLLVGTLLKTRDAVQADITKHVDQLRQSVQDAFRQIR